MLRAAALSIIVLLLCACGSSAPPDSAAIPEEPAPSPAVFDRVAADPTAPGLYAASSQLYDFGRIVVHDEVSGGSYESDVRGIAWYPQQPGARLPVLVWLHGRHQTCQLVIGGLPLLGVGDDDCPTGIPLFESAPSYRGYDAAAELLATQGYVVLSIDLNDVNDHDNTAPTDRGALARAELALEHLDRFRAIDAAGGDGFDALQGHLDFSRVGLMGHSRGGIGILKTAQENALRPAATRYGIRALFGLAPDTSGLNIGAAAYELEPDSAWAALIGYCDGDASDFFGSYYFDRNRLRADLAAPRYQLIAMGANHNYYNTEWAGSDDWSLADPFGQDPHCGRSSGERDSVADQQAQLQYFLASYFRWFVGDETAYAGYWQGREAVPADVCASGRADCAGRFHYSRWPLPGERLAVLSYAADSATDRNALGGPVALENLSTSLCTPDDGGDNPPSGGHGCPADPTFSRIPQLALSWTGTASLRAEFAAQDVRGYRRLALRLGLNGAEGANPPSGQDFEVVLRDRAGRSASLRASDWSDALFVPPGDPYADGGSQRTLLHGVYLPLAAFSGLDRGAITAVELRFGASAGGQLQLADLQFER
jgi:dienelactone hydrolase